jgi:metal-responsive CopG/Arc/MetJ family transcriptional regulator
VSIAFGDSLLASIDRLAKVEHRSRSEVIREAVRLYVEQRNRWDKIFALGETMARAKGLSERDVTTEIRAHRKR